MHIPRKWLIAATLIWLGGSVLGMLGLMVYNAKPGAELQVQNQWPGESHVERSLSQPTLIMFAHPKCPCTRASIDELLQLVTKAPGRAAISVLFYKPANGAADWEQTSLSAQARSIPGVKVLSDPEGREAQRFGAATSGHTFIYDKNGKLLFSGGLTGSRGHEGDNIGRRTAIDCLTSTQTKQNKTSVFGCEILNVCRENN